MSPPAPHPDAATDVHAPTTRYVTTRDGTRLAAQRFGRGPDLLVLTGGFSHVEMRWDEPRLARSWRRFSSFATVTAFDPRGFGLSERVGVASSIDVSIADAIDVLDAFGVQRAAVHGSYEAGPVALTFAAQHPDRVEQLFLENTTARGGPDPDYPEGMTPEVWDALREIVRHADLDQLTDLLAPGRAHEPAFRSWYGRWARYGAGPGGLDELLDRVEALDVRALLPEVPCPVTVIHRRDDPLIPLSAAEHVASAVPNGRLVVLGDDTNWYSNGADDCIDVIEAAMAADGSASFDDRTRYVLLVSDIVGSTAKAAELGDVEWLVILDAHDRAVSDVILRAGGRLVKQTGDGVLAVFGDSAVAARAALEVRAAVAAVGLQCRVGVHAGDVVRRGDDVGGLAVQIAARVCAEAAPDTVLVTSSVIDAGLPEDVVPRPVGARGLKGVPAERALFALEVAEIPAGSTPVKS
jgi:class 3 adenylate cyclase